MRRLLAAICAVFCLAAASDPSEQLKDPAQEARARALFAEIRCLVCQNESIDDSQAELAQDLRKLVREQIAAGRSDAQVMGYLESRYGEFVLLKPKVGGLNLLLWAVPFAVLVLGGLLLAGLLRRRAAAGAADLTPAEAERAEALARDEGS
jgi:cytochrome c-type biogenesis protein CcmH